MGGIPEQLWLYSVPTHTQNRTKLDLSGIGNGAIKNW